MPDVIADMAAKFRGGDSLQTMNPSFPHKISLHAIGLAFILIVAAVLRFYDLDRTSIWLDEAISWKQASLPFLEMLAATARDKNPPLHSIILKLTIALFGDSETALRAPSALLGVGAVYLLYRLGTMLFDRATGLIAALLLALSGFHVWYSNEARMYALLSFTATLFVLTVVQATRRPNWATLAGCAAAGTALLYSHVYGSFIFAGVSLYVWAGLLVRASWIRVSWRSWIVTQVAAIGLFLPWAIILLKRAWGVVGEETWIPEPTFAFVLEQLSALAGGELALLTLGMFAVLSAIEVAKFRTRLHDADATTATSWLRLDWRIGMVLVWLIAPVIIGYLISIAAQPLFYHRYLIGALPALMLLAARGLVSLSLTVNRAVLMIALAIVVVVVLPDWQRNLQRNRDDHRSAMKEFSARYRPSDRVLYVNNAEPPSAYYFRNPVENAQIHNDPAKISDDDIRDAERVWLVVRKKKGGALNELLARAKRTHHVVYSMTKGQASLYLLEATGPAR